LQALFEILAYLPWDWLFFRSGNSVLTSLEAEDRYQLLVAALSFGVGAGVGWGSLHYLPDLLAKWAWWRMASLLVLPGLSGGLAYAMAKRRQRTQPQARPWPHFWRAFLFTFGLVAVRFAFGVRG
jgi:hypothetical protein